MEIKKVKVISVIPAFKEPRIIFEDEDGNRGEVYNPHNIAVEHYEDIFIDILHKNELIPHKIYKTDIWRLATEEEVELMVEVLNRQSRKLQMIFYDTPFISTQDPLFPLIKAALSSVMKNDRVNELLTPRT